MKNFHEAFSGTSMDDMETAIRMIVHDSDLYFMIASLAGYLAGAGSSMGMFVCLKEHDRNQASA